MPVKPRIPGAKVSSGRGPAAEPGQAVTAGARASPQESTGKILQAGAHRGGMGSEPPSQGQRVRAPLWGEPRRRQPRVRGSPGPSLLGFLSLATQKMQLADKSFWRRIRRRWRLECPREVSALAPILLLSVLQNLPLLLRPDVLSGAEFAAGGTSGRAAPPAPDPWHRCGGRRGPEHRQLCLLPVTCTHDKCG